LKLLFVHILRFNMAEHKRKEQGCQSHPFALMFDQELRGVAETLHSNPEQPWTVAGMASKAGMSRTKFSTRFTRVAGVAPLAYLTSLRMMAAADLLERSDATLEKIAESTGYGSEPAFSTAFKRKMGMSPGAYRRRKECPTPALP
jgi:transcriptional regulator GlxA family with amidase domain